jgi:hypothetical protein
MTRTSIASRNRQLDAATAAVAGGTLAIYAGGQPLTADLPPLGAPLVTLRLGSPAFEPARTARARATAIEPGIATARGTATWFRISAVDTADHLDGKVSTLGAPGELQLPTVEIQPGDEIGVAILTLRLP